MEEPDPDIVSKHFFLENTGLSGSVLEKLPSRLQDEKQPCTANHKMVLYHDLRVGNLGCSRSVHLAITFKTVTDPPDLIRGII